MFGFLTPAVLATLARAAVALLVVVALAWLIVVPRLQLKAERAEHAATKARHAQELADIERAAAAQAARLQQRVDVARGDLDKALQEVTQRDEAITRIRFDAGRLSGDAQRLRGQLAAAGLAAANACPAGTAVAGNAHQLAADGIGLLAEGAGLVAACRSALAGCGADAARGDAIIRALIRGWPADAEQVRP